jgi:hypothetical protein
MAKKVLNSRLSFARNIIFIRKYAVTKFATAPSSETLPASVAQRKQKRTNIYE